MSQKGDTGLSDVRKEGAWRGAVLQITVYRCVEQSSDKHGRYYRGYRMGPTTL